MLLRLELVTFKKNNKEIMPKNFTIRVGDTLIVPEHEVTLLEVTLDSRLNFNTRINNILKEVSTKSQCSRTNCQIFE